MVALPDLLRTALIALFAGTLAFAPAHAAGLSQIIVETSAEYIVGDDDGADIASDQAELGDALLTDDSLAGAPPHAEGGPVRRFAPAPALARTSAAGAQFGPFTVVDGRTVRMVGDVTTATPHDFAAMRSAFPSLSRLVLVDCPGSIDEEANLALARAVRRAGMSTHVPAGGSVRSGAVELFLAGVTRSAHPTAEFGVHSWRDQDGNEAGDFPIDHPVHAEYLDYYHEVGMDQGRASAFYAMTNATGFDQVRYLTRADMARYVTLN